MLADDAKLLDDWVPAPTTTSPRVLDVGRLLPRDPADPDGHRTVGPHDALEQEQVIGRERAAARRNQEIEFDEPNFELTTNGSP